MNTQPASSIQDTRSTTGSAMPGASSATERTGTGNPANESFLSRDNIHRFADKAHQAIDRLQQKLSFGSGQGSSPATPTDLRERARQYGEQAMHAAQQARDYPGRLREQVTTEPIKATAVAFAAGVVWGMLPSGRRRHHHVEVVEVPVAHDAGASLSARANRWIGAAGERLHHLGESTHDTAQRLGAGTMSGASRARAYSSRLWHDTRKSMPYAKDQLLARSHHYGSLARTQMETHPLAGLAVAIGLGALAVRMTMGQRGYRYSARSSTLAVDKDGRPLRAEPGDRSASSMGAVAKPMMSGALVLGMGVILGALLSSRR
ncbi:hypothetical protein JI739_06900 [Ramlibacter sp. AW1]|uniref:DUF3618 domain-containing protein n=1 Tax=Ramlibacter aurantiacus TaxID=2801330 RepID=A0A936ZGZ4_9BURK|nr:hypothetical protein [Ramlibacter aurantiacus]MBL0420073.1 hypothetical protein [Ramlibacter aurantiacus]